MRQPTMLRAQQFAKAKQAAAAVALEDPSLYDGDLAGLVQWARLVVDITPAEGGVEPGGAVEAAGA